jgi:uncharacterized protein YndB with AHSA1/START domain
MPGPESPATQEKPSLRLERRYDATPEKVWRAWTDPKALSAWFGPGENNSVTRAETDVRVGGRFCVEFHTQDGEHHSVSGTYREVQPPHRLVFTWAWKSTPERESLVTVMLEAAGNGTQMNFVHERLHDEATRDSHIGGWTPTFEKLGHYLLQH